MKRTLAALAAALLTAACLTAMTTTTAAAATTPKAANGARISEHLTTAIAALHVAPAKPSGYVRSKFKLWDDADHDCRDTRAEVLAAESTKKVTGTCTIKTGHWTSYYDGKTFTDASGLDIDHLVPLGEVWASGGRSWSADKREAYANDLAESRTLVAVSAHANRSKGDRDPAQWMPDQKKCQYINQWVIVKTRWSLSIDSAEKAKLVQAAAGCPNAMLTTHKAKVVSTTSSGGSGGSGGGSGGGTAHGCTTTSSGSCIRGGEFCKQADYGHLGHDAAGHALVCGGDHTHPKWS